MNNITTRELDKCNPLDIALLTRLVDMYSQDNMGAGHALHPDAYQRLGKTFAEHPAVFALVAEEEDFPCGIALCVLGLSSFFAMPLVNIHDLSVIPEKRNKGVGKVLLEAVAEAAKKRGACKITLEVRPDNASARHLYQTAGFEVYAIGEEPYQMMEKLLVKPLF